MMTAGVVLAGMLASTGMAWSPGLRDPILWTGASMTMVVAGFTIGRIGRRIGFWEIYLATLITVIGVGLYLGQGWQAFGLGTSHPDELADLLHALPPGVQLFGPMWGRLLGMGAVAGFLLSVLGGSFAFMFHTDTGEWDSRFQMEWHIARRHLSLGKGGLASITALVAIIGIGVGVAALVAVTAVMSGYQEDIQSKILGTNAHLVVQKYGLDFTEYDQVIAKSLAVSDVRAATPFTFNEAILSGGTQTIGVLIKGIEPGTAGGVTGIADHLCDVTASDCVPLTAATKQQALITLLQPSETQLPGLIIGNALYQQLGQPIGSVIQLTTPVGMSGARGNAPRRMPFRIAGTFHSGMHEFDSRLVYLELKASQVLMGMGNAVSGVELRVQDPEDVDRIGQQVLEAVGQYPYRTLDWRALNAGIFMALKLQKIVMFLVLTFIVVVAAFNIASTLFMAVVEKSREIGVLKSMGATDNSIMKIFVLHGWVTGATGTTLGVAVGLGVAGLLSQLQVTIAPDVYMVDALQVRVNPVEVLLIVIAAMMISHLATLFPALKAARQHPVDAMRFE